jgi:putative membrane protein
LNTNLLTILKGAMMGIAEVIPGVSGGTIAFITGIYQRLLRSISNFDLSLFSVYRNEGVVGVWNKIDGQFLSKLLVGMVLGIVFGVFVISYFLENYPEPLWGFFFGLILASSIYVGRQIPKWNSKVVLSFIIGVVIAFGVTIVSPAEGSQNAFYIILSGTLAISALMLPGLSGSFVLLLLGMYTFIIPNLKLLIKDQNIESFKIIGLFAIGCGIGLVLFSRVLSWLFKHYEKVTLALLSGFMVGSLNKVWPWRNVNEILLKDGFVKTEINDISSLTQLANDSYKVLSEQNVMPSAYWGDNTYVFTTIVSFVTGFALVFLFEKWGSKENVAS